jgi:hypothetical protein
VNKEIRTVDTEKGIVQITSWDERWYGIDSKNEVTGLPEYKFLPSVTWIADYYPKGIGFYKWLADKGWDEAESLKESAGQKGSKVHLAVEKLLAGEVVNINSKILNKSTGQEEALSAEEYEAIMSFAEWHKDNNPTLLASEITVINEVIGYAGTVDFFCEISGEKWIIDFKTSANIWASHELQLSAYRHAIGVEGVKTAILQLGYKRNKYKKYKFTEIDDKFDLFLGAKKVWANENSGVVPAQKDYPLEIKLSLPVVPVIESVIKPIIDIIPESEVKTKKTK